MDMGDEASSLTSICMHCVVFQPYDSHGQEFGASKKASLRTWLWI
jgi:hypothetical protein